MNFPISIGRRSLFQILGVFGGIFHFYSIFDIIFCKQTVETLISSSVSDLGLHCLHPTERMLGLYGLMQFKSIAECFKWSILQYFRPSLSYHLSLRYLFSLFLSGCFIKVLQSLKPMAEYFTSSTVIMLTFEP